jgi:NAD(P)-dependent dehydrogenase (short-subunit alcohol dehydrogenase family)
MAKRALVVGGTSGIGYAMACRVAAEDLTSGVIISGRTKPSIIPHANMEFQPLDASSMRQIKQYTDAFKSAQGQKLDYLIMTQGILTMAGRSETSEGIDRKMALHYYGKQLLIRELLPALKEDAKVIIVLDGLRGSPDKVIWDDLDLKTHFSLGNAANQCISMNDAMVQYFADRQKQQGGEKRHFVHAYPGAVNTGVPKAMPWYLKPVMKVAITALGAPPDTCAANLLTGTTECTKLGTEEGRFWHNIDSKGKLIPKKAIWTPEQINKVADHTWELVDKAISSEN